MRSLTSLALLFALAASAARAAVPSVASLDAWARAAGNRKDVAVRLGDAVFATRWPAQVSQLSANQLGTHLILGVRLWGVKFHRPITRAQFLSEVTTLVAKAFAAVPAAEEVDLWASVPIAVGKGVIVNGDLAKPTSRVVYSLTVRRGESPAALATRAASANGVFWDEDWAHGAFKG